MPKKTSFSGQEILPKFDLSKRFCYFLSLATLNDPNNIAARVPSSRVLLARKKALLRDAIIGINQVIKNQISLSNRGSNEVIESAISFLDNVAKNERNKEIAVIEQYIDHLSNIPLINNILKNSNKSDIRDLLKSLKQFSEHPDKVNMKDFYTDLTACLNLVRDNAEKFEARVNQLLSQERKDLRDIENAEERFGAVAANQYSVVTGSIIDGLFNKMIGIKTREEEGSFASKIQDLLVNFIIEQINENQTAVLNIKIPALLVGLCMDFIHFLQIKKDTFKMAENFTDISDNLLNQWYEEWKKSDTFFLHGLQNQTKAFYDELESIERQMGFSQLTNDAAEKRKRLIDSRGRNRKNAKTPNPNTGYLAMKKNAIGKEIYKDMSQNLDWIHFNPKANRHGTIMEIIHEVVQNGIKVKGHAATDVVTYNIGKIKGDINLDYNELIRKNLKDMIIYIEKFEERQRKGREETLTQEFSNMNQEVHKTLKELDNQLKQLKIPQNLFVYHDSLKLYLRIEQHLTNEFHGRDLEILNALDRLYSMEGISELTLPAQEAMYNLALNLSKEAVGGKLKNSVENYLSIFSGLLMFDEIQNIAREAAKEATEKIEYSNLKTIHMYLLNDIYVPGSYLLSAISLALKDGYKQITASQHSAKVNIDTSGADSIINDYNKENIYGSHYYKIKHWNEKAEDIAKGIHMQITFMRGFFEFIANLQNRIA